MGIKALWIAFGAATSYAVAAIAAPIAISQLRSSGVPIGLEAATNLSGLAALLASAIGGVLGLRHAQRLEARRRAA